MNWGPYHSQGDRRRSGCLECIIVELMLRGDMTEVYKYMVLVHKSQSTVGSFIRRYELRLLKRYCTTNKIIFFRNRVVNSWKKLMSAIISPFLLISFKSS